MNKEKFIDIVKEYKQLVYKICHSYCSNHQEHKDLEQDILVQLWISMPRFNGSIQLSTWIYKIALNTAISFYRKEQKKKRITKEAFLTLYENDYNTETDKHIEQLYQFIHQLDQLDKAMILLYLDNIKYREISEILGLSESNVATKINRIKNKLKKYFNNE